jgi:hypothetical protein
MVASISILSAVLPILLAASDGQFPVPRAQQEFAQLGPHVRGYCGANEGNQETFRVSVLPFGPMDLTVSKGTRAEGESLRNLYLGFVSALCKVDAMAVANAYRCGPGCTLRRRDGLARELRQIKDVVNEFKALEGISLISQWGFPHEFRVDNVFVMMGQTRESPPSPLMGFVPSGVWEKLSGPAEYLKRKHVPADAFYKLVGKAGDLFLAALVREKNAIRVVHAGLSVYESGLLFLNDGATAPKVGEAADGGRMYSVVEPLEKGIVFYETN